MAKAKAKVSDEGNASKVIYVVLFATTLLVIAALFISVQQDNLTAWATANSNRLHDFMQLCHQNNGQVDVSPSPGEGISFLCSYPDGLKDTLLLSPKK